jgi:eukaryotic-like serine/threonine-protein kinase
VTGGGWGQDPFGGSPFGGGPVSGGPPGGGQFGGPPGGQFGGPPSTFTPPPVFRAAPPPQWPGGARANTLATLSVIFAFVFAPAGAVLGHLGLRQIARTGERGRDRAHIGIALSYSIIVISVIALVVWAVAGDDEQTPTAAPTRTFIPSSPTPTSSTPRTTIPAPPIDPPALTPGRTVDAADLPGVLLSVDEVKAALSKSPDAQPVPNLTASPPTTALEPSPGAQGSIDPADCAPAMIAGSEAGYQDSGYRAVYSVTMSQPGPVGAQAVTQSVLAFPDAASARQALVSVLSDIQQCSLRKGSGQGLPGSFSFTEPDGGADGDWAVTTSAASFQPIDVGDPFYAIHNQRFKPNSGTTGQFYTNERALGLKGNAIVDVSVRGLSVYFQNWDVISAILTKLS